MRRDNAEADILGANLYRRCLSGIAVPEPRRPPADVDLLPQTVNRVESILVSTGVHNSMTASSGGDAVADDCRQLSLCHCHRDFDDVSPELFTPTVSVKNVRHAVEYILQHDAT